MTIDVGNSDINDSLERDPLLWTLANVSLPRGAKWQFDGERRWQVNLFTDMSRQIVVRKSAQVGMTTTAICRVFHYLYYYPLYCMYTLPRRDDVTDFVDVYVDPLLSNSPAMQARLRFPDSKRVDSRRIKRFVAGANPSGSLESSFLIFMEASVEPRMIPVDVMINDEIDRSDPDNIEIFAARQENSAWKINYKFSTPSIEGYGISPYFLNSTQNYWHVRCRHCNHWNRLSWHSNFREPSLSMGPHLACERCDSVLRPEDIIDGQWISVGKRGPEVPTGYQVSNLLLPYSRPIERLYEQYLEAKRLKNFFNLTLGEEYTAPTGSITRDTIMNRCFQEPFPMEMMRDGQSQYYIGVDQGNDLYVVVSKRYGNQLRTVRTRRIPFDRADGFGEVAKMIDAYDAIAVIEAEPNKHSARRVQRMFPHGRVWLSKYNRIANEVAINRDTGGTVTISKTDAFDDLRDSIAMGRLQLWRDRGYVDPSILTLVDHLTNIKRDEDEIKMQHGATTIGVWKSVGPDHLAHAQLFAFVAWKFINAGHFEVSMMGVSPEKIQELVEEYRANVASESLRVATQPDNGPQEDVAGEMGSSKLGRLLRIG